MQQLQMSKLGFEYLLPQTSPLEKHTQKHYMYILHSQHLFYTKYEIRIVRLSFIIFLTRMQSILASHCLTCYTRR